MVTTVAFVQPFIPSVLPILRRVLLCFTSATGTSGRLITLTRSLLTLAKFTSDKPLVQLVPIALKPLIHDLLDDLTVLFAERRITLSLESQSVPGVFGDAQ
ncbi:MAG: hypothetical protein ABI604_17935 [Nitrospirota bacterium]